MKFLLLIYMNDDHRKHKNLSDTKKGEKKDPKADDSKQSYMERQLSISKHEEVLLKESREDSQCKKEIAETIRQSNRSLHSLCSKVSLSFTGPYKIYGNIWKCCIMK